VAFDSVSAEGRILFRPKAMPEFQELAVDWNNLLLACGRCHGVENKGIKFLKPDEGGPLVNPVEEDPDQHLQFDFDRQTKLAIVLGKTKRGDTTWKILGLNRREVVQHRSGYVKKLWVIAEYYDHVPAARKINHEAIRDDSEYAAFARALKRALETRANKTAASGH
jgi:hypothetical protein